MMSIMVMMCTSAGNVQNMKHVQNCTGFIFCSFSSSVIAKYNYQVYFRLQGLKSGMKENASDVNKGNEVYKGAGN